MSLGPIEILFLKFPNHAIKDDIALALKRLTENKTIRIIDILFIRKLENGEVTVTEIDELEDIDHSILDPAIAEINGLISESDVEAIAQSLDSNSFAALFLFEHTWATAFRDAVLSAGGELLLSERIPNSVVEEVLVSQSQAAP